MVSIEEKENIDSGLINSGDNFIQFLLNPFLSNQKIF